MEIEGVAAIITGGASGIGEASARRLSALGARCVIVDRDEARGKEVASALEGEFVMADVANADEVQVAIDAACALGPLRVLVNSAGVGWVGRTVDREGNPHDLAAFERIVRINLIGSFNCLRLAAAAMARMDPVDADGQRGVIVNMASAAAFDGQTGQVAYAASKGGVVGMTLPAARDLRAIGVRVNTLAPGLIDTPIYGAGEASEQFKAKLGENVIFPKRLGSSDDVASMVIELITNDYMNAEVVRVDGGVRLPPK